MSRPPPPRAAVPPVDLDEFEIASLWSNSLLVQQLPGHEPHSARLGALVDQGDAATLLDSDDEAVAWLRANVVHGIGALLADAGFPRPPQVSVRVRVETQQLEAYDSLRNRPGAYLTGTYVVRAARGRRVLGARDDGRPGCISFYDPRAGMNMNAIRKDPYVLYHHTVELVPGLLALWPAYLPCFVHPHLSDEPALRIGVDVQVEPGQAP